jgi:RNA polymerase sigma factor (sigma-70 family)
MDHDPATRASLLLRLRDRADERAWSEFVAIYAPLIRQLARRKGLRDADADDLVQDVLGAVAGEIERGLYDSARGSFRGWLFTITRRLVINFVLSQRRHPRGSGDTDMLRFLEERPAPEPDESAVFEAAYRRRLLHWAAQRVRDEFPDRAWEAFWKTGVDGRPASEVAERLGTTVGTVYFYKSRVMARLRREIARAEGEWERNGS